jgi:putative flippase GtrA
MRTEIATPAGQTDRSAWPLPFSPAFARFIVVGAVAYLINQAVLLLLYDLLPLLPPRDTSVDLWLFTHPDVRLLIASVIAVEFAIVFKFYAHDHWTFPDRRKPGLRLWRFVQFNASHILSPIITVSTVNILTPVFSISPYVSNTIGAVVGLLVNWSVSAYLIWPIQHREQHHTV